MAGIQVVGSTVANVLEVDTNKNAYTRPGIPAIPSAGGFYSVCGGPAGIVAATLAADTSLFAMRFSVGSTRKAYITRMRFTVSVATVGASAGVAGAYGIQRFTTATPSGGTSRTVAEYDVASTATDMTSVQDLASALTMTSVVFTDELAWERQSLAITGTSAPHVFEILPAAWSSPIVLAAGDGLCFRTRVALAATQTWVFAYTIEWFEK
jgi:hypothetical protein